MTDATRTIQQRLSLSTRVAVVAVWALAAASCVPSKPPLTPTPPTQQNHVTVRDSAGAQFGAAAVAIRSDSQVDSACSAPDAANPGSFVCTTTAKDGATLTVSADGYATTTEQGIHIGDDLPDVWLQPAAPPPLHAVGDESGWLRRDGARFVREDGSTWRGRGATGFTLLKNFCDGQNVRPYLDDVVARGANYVRVLGMFNGALGRFVPAEYGDRWFDCLHGLWALLGDEYHIRGELSVLADAQNVMKEHADQQAWVNRVAAALEQHWNVLGELGNEYWVNGFDPRQFARPPPGRVLWASGVGMEDRPELGLPDDSHGPVWDYVTHHSSRGEDWPRKVEARPIMDTQGHPCLEDEPMGASAVDQPGKRSNKPDDFAYFGGLCSLWAAGCLAHGDAYIFAQPASGVEGDAISALLTAIRHAPESAPYWTYQRGDNCGDCSAIGNMPLAQRDTPQADGTGTLRTACRPSGNAEWCVAVRPEPNWRAASRDGWTILSQRGPMGALVELGR